MVIVNEVILDSQHVFLDSIYCNGVAKEGISHQQKGGVLSHNQIPILLGNLDKKWVGSKIVGYYKLLEVKSFSGLMCPKVFSTGTPGSSVESSARKRQETSSGLGWNR